MGVNSSPLKCKKNRWHDSCFQSFKNMSSKVHVQVYDTENPKTREQLNSVDPDEEAHDEPPHLDIRCLLIQLFFIFGAFRLKERICSDS